MTASIEQSLQDYFDGLYKSDTALLRTVFHPQAVYASATDGELVHRTMDEYFPIVDTRPSPASRHQSRHDRVVSIDLAGPVTAVARVECAIRPKRFEDILILVRLDDRWQIIAKVFHYETAEAA